MHGQELVSLADIARLAQVQRPVVSMWRSRSRGSTSPFPAPAGNKGSQDLFKTSEIVEWLRATGRGNNPEFSADASAFSTIARENFREISALLVLQQLMGLPLAGLDADGLTDAADEIDPDDNFLYSEISEASKRLESLVPYVDRLIDASYGAQPAFELLLADRFRADAISLSRTAMSVTVRQLVARCALELSGSATLFHEATAGGSDLIHELVRISGESAALSIHQPSVLEDSSSHVRMTIRRLKMLEATNESLTIVRPHDGSLPTVHLAQFPSPDAPDDGPEAILQAIDDLVLELGPSQGAIILGPASVLVDSMDSKSAIDFRAQILRMGRVRAAVKLPQGHFLYKPRAVMGLWVVGPDVAEVPISDRRIMLANLSHTDLDETVISDFVTDLAASLVGEQGLRSHAFRFAQWARTSTVVASTTDLVPGRTSAKPRRFPDTATQAKTLVELELALEDLNSGGNSRPKLQFRLAARAAADSSHQNRSETATLGELVARQVVKLIPGTRFSEASLATPPKEGIKVWSAEDLSLGYPSTSVSYFEIAQTYEQAELTEPGDVVFVAAGTPAAVVDREGSQAVRYPVRILRINSADASGIVPEVMADDINAARQRNWQQWEIHKLPNDIPVSLEKPLRDIAEERQAAMQRIALLDDMSRKLVGALSSGELEIFVSDTVKEGRP